jgi:hypothetical protein
MLKKAPRGIPEVFGESSESLRESLRLVVSWDDH